VPCRRPCHLLAVVARDHPQRQVDPGQDACRREDVRVLDDMLVRRTNRKTVELLTQTDTYC
jgi:hypothetical protein